MKLPSDVIRKLQSFAELNSLSFLAVFGSYYTETATDESDIDIMIDTEARCKDLDMECVQASLQNLIGLEVDLSSVASVIDSSIICKVWIRGEYLIVYGKPVVSDSASLMRDWGSDYFEEIYSEVFGAKLKESSEKMKHLVMV